MVALSHRSPRTLPGRRVCRSGLLESRFAAPAALSTVRDHNRALIRGLFNASKQTKSVHLSPILL